MRFISHLVLPNGTILEVGVFSPILDKIRQYHANSAADLLKEVMDYYNITQVDLANRIGVSQKNLSDILNRKRYLTEVLALRIEKVMGISSRFLLSLDSNYKLNLAKQNQPTANGKPHSPLFLQKYNWVTTAQNS